MSLFSELNGAVVVLRLYDVAYAIDLPRIEALAATPVSRIRLTHAEPKAIRFGVPPLELALGTVDLPLRPGCVAHVSARIYEFGVISIAVRVPVEHIAWDDYVQLVNSAYRWSQGEQGTAVLHEQLERVRTLVLSALERPSAEHLEEDYLIASINRFDRDITADEFIAGTDLVPLLSGESVLSAATSAELLRYRYSYQPADAVLLTWDRALIIEPTEDTDVDDVIEVANAQLLELRYYDDLLDEELPRMYDRVEDARRAFRGLGRRRYAALARQLHALVGEVTEITERIDNALKVTEDVYLARVYGGTLDLLRTRSWTQGIDRKLGIIRDTYAALYDDAANARAELMEAAIILLILLELILAF